MLDVVPVHLSNNSTCHTISVHPGPWMTPTGSPCQDVQTIKSLLVDCGCSVIEFNESVPITSSSGHPGLLPLAVHLRMQ